MQVLQRISLLFIFMHCALAQDTIEAKVLERAAIPLNIQEVQRKIGYPEKAKEAGIQGIVTVRVLVNKEGEYVKHIVLSSPDPILTEAVEKEIPNLKFKPAVVNGDITEIWINIPFRFSLKASSLHSK